MERFIGVLIEHFAGAFPLWLAPEQARILTVSEKSEEYGRQVEERFRASGLRASGEYRGQKLSAKVREAQLDLVPYMLVVGERDRDSGTVTLRDRIEGDLGPMSLEACLEKLLKEVREKTVRQVAQRESAALADRGISHEY
jgi:threonyl-tRNA synthetase